ncbi:ATP-binding cassette domain-containing protein [Hyphomonas pacifica]|uniref:ATP-binding cassette domain-containing protein n=1 Tax=Hyphomonas pacifica TaxID=1280941 RepID=UPI0018EFEC89|nr:ATP-binding cassette domain-containing protein [Hyphomonas pacifica]
MPGPLVQIEQLTKRFAQGDLAALDDVTASVSAGEVTGLVGPDGAGKTTLLRLIAGLLVPSTGKITVQGLDPVSDARAVHRIVSYMPQRFGLYEDLSVQENLTLYADLRSVTGADRDDAFERLLRFTGLTDFKKRLAGALSGGMKQKLGLACALIKTPDLLLLDEPSVGVDPISRRELWRMVYDLVDQGIGVVWSTAYLDEAERCARVLLLNEGSLLYAGSPQDLTDRVAGRTYQIRHISTDRRQVLSEATKLDGVIDGVIQGSRVRLVLAEGAETPSLDLLHAGDQSEMTLTPPRFEDAFMDLIGGGFKANSPFADRQDAATHTVDKVVEANALTRRFGDFIAADDISFDVGRGEIFGLIGPNGAGKSTTFKMLCGLLRPSAGSARVVGLDLQNAPSKARGRIGYMAQKFSLYGDLSVRQNLDFFAGVYGLRGQARKAAIERMIDTFGLSDKLIVNALSLPLGYKQRLALACAVMHDPDVLFLDEPTSGVDPRTRREFWTHINAMVANGVTIMVTTHFLDEAEYCDRIALIYRSRMIASGSPDDLKDRARAHGLEDPTLEDAFIALVEQSDREREAA